MKKTSLIITTRQSPLALQQARWVANQLAVFHPEMTIELLGLTTRADRMLSISLAKEGGKGLFVKELEEALLAKRAQLAVHSMKDMPMELPAGLTVPVISEREDPRDVFISNRYGSFEELPKGARIGTSSLRRQCQLRALRADLQLENVRGNVNSRLTRLDCGELDALVLAAAGIKRLGLEARISAFFSAEQILPAVGQGALALECREDDAFTHDHIYPLNHPETFLCVTAERALCQRLGGGCQVPVAAYAELKGTEVIELRGLVGSVDGKTILTACQQGAATAPEELGKAVADSLLAKGAGYILKEFT